MPIRAESLGLSRTVRGGWRRTDVTGEALTQERRSGAVATLAASRGTSCSVEVAKSVVRRINGHRLPAVERVLRTMQEMRAATLGLMRWLTPPDFARFVDLVFASSGSRRVGTLGRAQKTLNVDLVLPIMGHEHARALVHGSSAWRPWASVEVLAVLRARGARSRYEVEGSTEVQDEIPRRELAGIRPSAGPARRRDAVAVCRRAGRVATVAVWPTGRTAAVL